MIFGGGKGSKKGIDWDEGHRIFIFIYMIYIYIFIRLDRYSCMILHARCLALYLMIRSYSVPSQEVSQSRCVLLKAAIDGN